MVPYTAFPVAYRLCPAMAWRPWRIGVGASRRGVAQLAEQRSPKPQVAGSSPVAPAPGHAPWPRHERLVAQRVVALTVVGLTEERIA